MQALATEWPRKSLQPNKSQERLSPDNRKLSGVPPLVAFVGVWIPEEHQ